MSGVPVGRRGLFAERRRAFLGIAGVAVALLLALTLDGIFAGVTRGLSRYIDTSPADLFVSQQGVRTMHMSSSVIPVADAAAVAQLPGVTWAEPILYQSGAITAGGARQLSYVVGFVPGGRAGPVVVSGRPPERGEVVIDERAASVMDVPIGSSVGILGRPWVVSGFARGLTNITNTVAFVPFDDFAAVLGAGGTASYLLVGAAGDPAATAARIEDATGLTAQTRARFSAEERRIVRDMSADLMMIMATASFLIGLVVVGLTLYAATLGRIREIGVMKALGATRARLVRIVLSQAAWTVGPAVALAVALAFALAGAMSLSPNVTMVIEAGSVVRVTVGALILAALGAVAPLARVGRVDPATVFRR